MKNKWIRFRDFDKVIQKKIGIPVMIGVAAMIVCVLLAKLLVKPFYMRVGLFLMTLFLSYGGFDYYMAANGEIAKIVVRIEEAEKSPLFRNSMDYTMIDVETKQVYIKSLHDHYFSKPFEVGDLIAYYVHSTCLKYQPTEEGEPVYLSKQIAIERLCGDTNSVQPRA